MKNLETATIGELLDEASIKLARLRFACNDVDASKIKEIQKRVNVANAWLALHGHELDAISNRLATARKYGGVK